MSIVTDIAQRWVTLMIKANGWRRQGHIVLSYTSPPKIGHSASLSKIFLSDLLILPVISLFSRYTSKHIRFSITAGLSIIGCISCHLIGYVPQNKITYFYFISMFANKKVPGLMTV